MPRSWHRPNADEDRARHGGLPAPAEGLLTDLRAALSGADRVLHRASDRLARANDASHYMLTPQAVVAPDSAEEVGRLLRATAALGVPLTFRSGGTSLSGQGVTDGVLVDTRRHFRDIEVLDGGARVRVQPGAVVRQVNARLAPFGRKLGPDPASESACTVGGVIANNSSGMACGTRHNTYSTLDSLTLVLPSGTVIDTGEPDADERLRAREPALYEGLDRLRQRILANPESVRTIRRQFAMKNTMGYGLNSFLDHSRPVDVLAHLVVGSEGTLAFVAEATFRAVPVMPHAVTGLLVFDTLSAATGALPALVETAPATIELLDAASLRVGQLDPQADRVLQEIAVANHAALLVEYQEQSADALAAHTADHKGVLQQLPLSTPAHLTGDPRSRNRLWHVRKGLYAAVAGARPSGTTALLEDIVVPVPALLATCEELTRLFNRHGYHDSVIFGHAKDGNIHFMLNERFEDPENLTRYHRFSEDIVDLVLGHGGSLKAEHGTGRMMAPYVRRQYGDELYDVMCDIKRLCDPGGFLNPGVIINDDPGAHVQHLKTTPTVEPEVDRCVECGYCEPVCPSRDLTTTPRQRIVLRRAMVAAEARGDLELLRELDEDYDYDAVQTCAVDGMCQTACPVLINTGDLVKRLRAREHGKVSEAGWRTAAKHWGATTRAAALALDIAASLPEPVVTGATKAARRVGGEEAVPLWTADLPPGGQARRRLIDQESERSGHREVDAVFFSACVGSMFGTTTREAGAGRAFAELSRLAGVRLALPPELDSLCCGTPWQSKGLRSGYDTMRQRLLPALWEASRHGELPVVCDASSCTEGLRSSVAAARAEGSPYEGLRVVDAVEFVSQYVLPEIEVKRRLPSLALHPTCSSTRLGLDDALRSLAGAVADEVVVPQAWGCCAFAGDRGLLHPELTASATRAESAELAGRTYTAYASCNRTCEIGMTRATGHDYRHILELLWEALL
ncbi:FAD-binding and (Fe-S)-binding domain-containing protein [Actinacidiphila soli]|uniref:FAD-binding and (Fe-S)-binding domain-containing protein n=1 Tax=Actinacidiphila soli TaxID=2487275 RepID=UPI000FCA2CCA|nr:FAD-binding and (Fe-S)-binding domain-containing protein [Actinacidiphila soli]